MLLVCLYAPAYAVCAQVVTTGPNTTKKTLSGDALLERWHQEANPGAEGAALVAEEARRDIQSELTGDLAIG